MLRHWFLESLYLCSKSIATDASLRSVSETRTYVYNGAVMIKSPPTFPRPSPTMAEM